MTIKSIPWAVTGNEQTLHTSALVRNANFALSGGKTGVVNNGFKVTANSSPNNTIIVSKGTALIRNYKAQDEEQSYIVSSSGDTALTLNTTATTGSRTDLVILTIQDPEYDSTVTMNSSHEFVKIRVLTQNEAGTLFMQGIPFIPLCQITWPSRTTQITNNMITDTRVFADNSNVVSHTPTLQNGWRTYNNKTPTYYKTADNIVHLSGVVSNTTSTLWKVIFTLPEGYRPSKDLDLFGFYAKSRNPKQVNAIAINTSGEVSIENGNVDYTTLDGISFLAAPEE